MQYAVLSGDGPWDCPLVFMEVLTMADDRTVYEWCFDFCKERGMCNTAAAATLEILIATPANMAMRQRWGEQIRDYTDPTKALLKSGIEQAGLKWILDNDPTVWYRPLFDGSLKVPE